MGNSQTKKVDSTGEVINSIVINPVDVVSTRLETILIVLTALVGTSLIYQFYKDYRRSIKKKYSIQNSANPA